MLYYFKRNDKSVYLCIFHVVQWFTKFRGYITVNVMKFIIMRISRLLCIISSPIEKSNEKQKFYQIFRLFCMIFMLNGKFEYQIDYLSQ